MSPNGTATIAKPSIDRTRAFLKSHIRLLLAGLPAVTVTYSLILFGCAVERFIAWHAIDAGMKVVRLDSDEIRLASTLFFEKMTALAQITLATLGAMWAFHAIADTRVSFERPSAKVLLGSVTTVFVMSLLAYDVGYDLIVRRIFYHSAFDVGAPVVSFWANTQRLFFAIGAVGMGLIILFCRQE